MRTSRATGRIAEVSLVVWAVLVTPSESAAQIAAVRVADAGDRTAVIAEIVFLGLRRISPEALTSKITSRPGIALDERLVERDVRALARLGWFDDVRADVGNVESIGFSGHSQKVRLTFYLPELPFLTSVEFSGSRLLSRQQIDKLLAEKKLAPKLGEPENAAMLHRAAREIESALAELGHPDASVAIHREETAQATVRVRFEIHDGPHIPVGRLTFSGDPEISHKVLRRRMCRIVPGAWFASLRGKNSFTQDAFEDDRARLLAYYQNHGYPDARIGTAKSWEYEESSQRWFPQPHKVKKEKLGVAIPVEAGHFYRTTSADVGAALQQATGVGGEARTEQLRSLVDHAYSAQSVENLRQALETRVRANARKQTVVAISNVEAIRTMDAETHSVLIRFDPSSVPPYTVRRLEFRGMKHFPDRYFRRRIGVKEGAPLDERALEAGLARLARTGYFKPIKKEDVHIDPDDGARSVDVYIHIEELGQQRVSLVGGHGQFGTTLGIAYSLFNLLDREELLTSKIEGGPESLELAMGLAKEGFFGSRGSLALSVFNMFLRPMLTGSVKGPFFQQRSEGVNAGYSYALTTRDVLTANYGLSYSDTTYSPTVFSGTDALAPGDVHARSSSRNVGFGWTHNTGDQQIVLADSVSGGWLGGSENLLRSKAEYGRMFRDPIFNSQNAWAFRTTFSGIGSYSGDMPPAARWYSGDEFVRGLRNGQLGPQAVVSSMGAAGTTRYSSASAGANLIGAANAEYRLRLGGGTEGVGFFDLGSGLLEQNWLGHWRPTAIDSTNGILHGSTGIELRWTMPGIGVPVRVYYALNVLRLNHSVWMPDGSLLHLRNPLAAFGWGLGSLF
jgi:outer membrane protein assembly complex protein YaeT